MLKFLFIFIFSHLLLHNYSFGAIVRSGPVPPTPAADGSICEALTCFDGEFVKLNDSDANDFGDELYVINSQCVKGQYQRLITCSNSLRVAVNSQYLLTQVEIAHCINGQWMTEQNGDQEPIAIDTLSCKKEL